MTFSFHRDGRQRHGDELHTINIQCLPTSCGWNLLMPAEVDAMVRSQASH